MTGVFFFPLIDFGGDGGSQLPLPCFSKRASSTAAALEQLDREIVGRLLVSEGLPCIVVHNAAVPFRVDGGRKLLLAEPQRGHVLTEVVVGILDDDMARLGAISLNGLASGRPAECRPRRV